MREISTSFFNKGKGEAIMISNKLRKIISNHLSDQKGLALIILVLMAWFVAVVAISQMLITTGTQLSDTNLEIALKWAEQSAIATSSPIRDSIDNQVYRKIQQQLLDHLQREAAARAAKRPFVCQGMIGPEETISSQYSICDPV